MPDVAGIEAVIFTENSRIAIGFWGMGFRVFTGIVTIIEKVRTIIENGIRLSIDPVSLSMDQIPIIDRLAMIIEKVLTILKNGIPFSIVGRSGSIDQIPIIEKVLMISVLGRTISVLRPIVSIDLAILLMSGPIRSIYGTMLALTLAVDRVAIG